MSVSSFLGMSSQEALLPLQKTLDALEVIEVRLIPFLQILQEHKNTKACGQAQGVQRHMKSEAYAAISLALGTLRFMDARLQGIAKPKMELEKMRKAIIELNKVDPRSKETNTINRGKSKEEQLSPSRQSPDDAQIKTPKMNKKAEITSATKFSVPNERLKEGSYSEKRRKL